ncbi:MAG: hypothetical protein DMG53_23965, partial [Acidobacteria bacterium]
PAGRRGLLLTHVTREIARTHHDGRLAGQTYGPVMAGHIFDIYHNYDLAWGIVTSGGILGAITTYFISTTRFRH